VRARLGGGVRAGEPRSRGRTGGHGGGHGGGRGGGRGQDGRLAAGAGSNSRGGARRARRRRTRAWRGRRFGGVGAHRWGVGRSALVRGVRHASLLAGEQGHGSWESLSLTGRPRVRARLTTHPVHTGSVLPDCSVRVVLIWQLLPWSDSCATMRVATALLSRSTAGWTARL
jgi:hypothetical protein